MTDYDFAVVLKSTGRRVGGINLILKGDGAATIGWILALEYHHTGIMTEAARRLLRFAFGELALTYVEAVAASDDVCSVGLMEKLGMKLVRTIPEGWEKNRRQAAAGATRSTTLSPPSNGSGRINKQGLPHVRLLRLATAIFIP